MGRLLFTRRWLGAVALALVFFAVCVQLGRWQWGRHVDRSAAAALVAAHYDAAPVPLDAVLPAGEDELDPTRDWTRVTASGQYDLGGQLLARNRPQAGVYGYEVLVPLRLPDGSALLVNRGWVRNAERADVLPQPPAAPEGEVSVLGWLRVGEPSLGREGLTGQLASIHLPEAAAATGQRLRGAYLILDREDVAGGGAVPRPAPLAPPDTTTGPHFAYAMEWWLTAPLGMVLVSVLARRESREGAPASAPARPSKPKKTRIWDEEDA